MKFRVLIAVAVLLVIAVAFVYVAGLGWFGEPVHGGEPQARAVDPAIVSDRSRAQREAARAVGVAQPKQILFGDLHVHSTFSFDAYQMSLPMAGGDGAHPVADACDYARHCSALDFWSINDHAITLTPRAWSETVESIRQCNAVAGDPAAPDSVAYLGWEWTQVGATPKTHWGHKNVVLRGLADDAITARPIAAGNVLGRGSTADAMPHTLVMGLLALSDWPGGGPGFARFMQETGRVEDCPKGVPVRELSSDCRETADEPAELFAKLDDWGVPSMVIPHGTTWGFYTPPGSSWDKQLGAQHDPERQRLVEVFSGHGNSEEFRPWREVVIAADGSRSCPEPAGDYLPTCWRAGEIIETRCLDADGNAETCAERAVEARQLFVDADMNGGAATVPGWEPGEWQDAGQCRDCFQPAFNYRPRSSVQYLMSLEKPGSEAGRFRFGFIASSDNHSARPGTGYKEVARTEFTEQRFGNFANTPIGMKAEEDPELRSVAYDPGPLDAPFAAWETERQASFFLNGGLAAVHAKGRSREAIWEAMERREVYGTSGPRILLWFDLINPPGGRPLPMGSEVSMSQPPIFQVRAQGSFVQKPGCPADALDALGDRVERLCQGECYHPGDARRPIERLEVVRIRPGGGPALQRIDDPWQVIECPGDGSGCQGAFSDPSFGREGRDALYYVRAVEAPSPAVAADPLGCRRNAEGRCVETDPCSERADTDECLSETHERAWSSPIFVDFAG